MTPHPQSQAGSAELLALADFLAHQNSFHSESICAHDPIIVEHVAKLAAWERIVRELTRPVPGAGDAVREALENSQSLIVMLVQLGDGRCAMGFQYPEGITVSEWKAEGLTNLLDEQIAENRAALTKGQTAD